MSIKSLHQLNITYQRYRQLSEHFFNVLFEIFMTRLKERNLTPLNERQIYVTLQTCQSLILLADSVFKYHLFVVVVVFH